MSKTQRLDEAYRELEGSYDLVIRAENKRDLLTALKALRSDALWIENIIKAQMREDAGVPDPKPKKRTRRRLTPSSRKHKKKLTSSSKKTQKALPPGKKK